MSKPRVLLVEDNEANIYLMRFLLEQSGCAVRCVENGRQCLDAVEAETPDLIIMDMQMPVLDGYETGKRLQENPATKNIPMIASSAYAQPEDEQRALELGFACYISKPFDPVDFVERIKPYLPSE
jgi:two-component system cell cycle response regulator DivK